MQLQLTISLALIAAAAVIALICDFLRAKNAQLRRAVAELEACNRTLQAREKAANAARQGSAGPRSRSQVGPVLPVQRTSKESRIASGKALSDWLAQCADRAAEKTSDAADPDHPGTNEPVARRLWDALPLEVRRAVV